MFIMTSEIRIGDYFVKPASVDWTCSVSNLIDTCTIQLPRIVFTRNSNKENVPFETGDAVEVKVGYNNNNKTVFKGFLKRITQKLSKKPLHVMELLCHGYGSKLNNVFTKSYPSTSLKDLLQDLTKGTGIELSSAIPTITLKNVTLKKMTGMQVLEWLQKMCLCRVFFDLDQLYVGALKYGIPKPSQRLSIGWNTINNSDFVSVPPVNVQIIEKDSTGQIKKTNPNTQGNNTTEEVLIKNDLPSDFVKDVANTLQQENARFTSNITCFLEPHFEKGCSVDITDPHSSVHTGAIFVESVAGRFNDTGGRQIITVNQYRNVDR